VLKKPQVFLILKINHFQMQSVQKAGILLFIFGIVFNPLKSLGQPAEKLIKVLVAPHHEN